MINVSVIVPVYKVENYIGECLKSLIRQNYTGKIECILVDDKSPDDSIGIVERMLSVYDGPISFRILRHECNRGLSAARNSGVDIARGRWLYFLDSDDEIMPSCLRGMMDLADRYEPDFVIGDMLVTGADRHYLLASEPLLSDNTRIFTDYVRGKWNQMACNKLISREFFMEKRLYFVEGLLHEDLLFSFALALNASRMCCLYEKTYLYKVRKEGSITSEMSLRHYQSWVEIISKRVDLVQKLFLPTTSLPVYDSLINSIYCFSVSILQSPQLNSDEREQLFSELKKSEIRMNDFKKNVGIKVFIKIVILSLPLRFLTILIRCAKYSIIK